MGYVLVADVGVLRQCVEVGTAKVLEELGAGWIRQGNAGIGHGYAASPAAQRNWTATLLCCAAPTLLVIVFF